MKTILQLIDEALEKLQCLELELTASGIEHVDLLEKVKKQEEQLQQLNKEKQDLSKELQSCQERLCLLEKQFSKWDVTADVMAENLVLINENEELKIENEMLLNSHSSDYSKCVEESLDETNDMEHELKSKETKPTKKTGKSKKKIIDKDSSDTANQLYFDFIDN